MMHEYNEFRENDSTWDRLVDGELTEHEYKELLVSCDEDPRRWRQCALAFLEAQTWSREMSLFEKHKSQISSDEKELLENDLAQSDGNSLVNNAEFRTVKSSSSSIGRKGMIRGLSLALSVLAAFFLGMMVPKSSEMTEIADPGKIPGATALVTEPSVEEPAPYVTLVVDGPDNSRQERYQLPLVQGNESIDQLLSSQESPVPSALLNVLTNLGHEVQREREFYPVRLEDGRSLVVPVENLRIKPIMNRSFQ